MTHPMNDWKGRVTQRLADATIELEAVREDHCVFWIRTFASGMFGPGDFRTALLDARNRWHNHNLPPTQGNPRAGVSINRAYQTALGSMWGAIYDMEFMRHTDVDISVFQQRDGLIELRSAIERAQHEPVDQVVSPGRTEQRESVR
ncbi:hypothetical protein B0A48_03207 [Cryoendolithus antarcticus]|uniref:Uncharacterized protein n=1 Tax=Cryoendolithus antarcticus TaxID=1507870 RepID=A0A1V8TJC4_9PEZI|nr:hypothetical protein B0A48_03207 [Cryoendolithus antarcticus]